MKKISEYVVVGSDGAIDCDATVDKFTEALYAYVESSEAQVAQIAGAVTAVFDQYKGVRLNMPALVNFALAKLETTPANHGELSEECASFIRANAVTEKNPEGIYRISKGHSGGVTRVCDEKPKTENKAA